MWNPFLFLQPYLSRCRVTSHENGRLKNVAARFVSGVTPSLVSIARSRAAPEPPRTVRQFQRPVSLIDELRMAIKAPDHGRAAVTFGKDFIRRAGAVIESGFITFKEEHRIGGELAILVSGVRGR